MQIDHCVYSSVCCLFLVDGVTFLELSFEVFNISMLIPYYKHYPPGHC